MITGRRLLFAFIIGTMLCISVQHVFHVPEGMRIFLFAGAAALYLWTWRACKRGVAVLFFAFMATSAHAACTGSHPTWTATVDQTSVNSCISSASDGDTINVSSGSATWTSVSIPSNKGLTLSCASGCTVTLNGDKALQITTGSTTGHATLTGFTFTDTNCGSDGCLYVTIASGNTISRVYNNTFTASGGSAGIQITYFGAVAVPALFDHNTINAEAEADETVHIWGAGDGCTSCWTEDVTPGGSSMLFLENNLWNAQNNSSYCQAEEAFYGAVFVARYNHMNNCQDDVHATDHGNRWVELYKNNYNNCCSSGSFFDWRGGGGVYWGNTVSGSTNGNASVGPEGSDQTGSYPVPYQFGMGISGTNYNPNYNWGNSSPMNSISNQNTAMVQIGNAPSDSTDCHGLTGAPFPCNMVLTTTQPATLLRCESAADVSAGCPVSYTYSSYTYPHPLDNCPSSTYGVVGGGCSGGGSVSLAPSSQNFGSVNVSSSSSPTTFTLTNNSSSSATSVATSITGTNAGDFTKGSDTCNGSSVAALGGTCSLTVTFSPTASGSRSATLSISYSGADGASPKTSALSGTGVTAPPVPVFTPSTVAFGNQPILQVSPPISVTLQNTGTGNYVVSQWSLNNNYYSIQANTCSTPTAFSFGTNGNTFTLGPGGSCTFQVLYYPNVIGQTNAGSVVFTDNTSGGHTTLVFSGTGTTPPYPAIPILSAVVVQ